MCNFSLCLHSPFTPSLFICKKKARGTTFLLQSRDLTVTPVNASSPAPTRRFYISSNCNSEVGHVFVRTNSSHLMHVILLCCRFFEVIIFYYRCYMHVFRYTLPILAHMSYFE